MKKKENLSWNDVSLKKFVALQELIKNNEDETETLIGIMELMFGEGVTDLPLSEFKDKANELSFLKEEMPVSNPPKKITVNDRKYFVDCLLGNVTTAQYVDYMNQSKTGDLSKILSVFIIPEGHKYNDGYDMLQVFDDINDMSVTVVSSAAFFFARQFRLFIQIFQRYFKRKMKEMNLNEKESSLLNMILELEVKSMDMVSFLTSLNSVK